MLFGIALYSYKDGEQRTISVLFQAIREALRLFHKINDFDCTTLIEGCDMLLGIAQANKPKPPAAPSGSQQP